MKLALSFLIIAVLVVAGAWYVVVNTGPATPEPSEPQTPATSTDNGAGEVPGEDDATDEDGPDTPASWQTFQSEEQDGYTFTLSYPPEAELSQVQPTIYELKFIGPDAEPNTEITDGYYLSFVFRGNATLGSYEGREDASTPISSVTFNGHPAIAYDTTSVLTGGLVPHTVIAPRGTESPILDITAQVYGDGDGSYQTAVDLILSTVRFEEAPANGGSGTDNAADDLINVSEPSPGETITSPVAVSGEARGNWYFEATAPVVIVDWDGRIIGEGFIEAEGDWMTEDFVPFSGSITYEQEPQPVSASGTVIFQKANPSGLPENDAAIEVPVILE